MTTVQPQQLALDLPREPGAGRSRYAASAVFVDALFVCRARGAQAYRVGSRHGHRWSHMWSDDVEALHALARKLGLDRDWFQDKPNFQHYDLVPSKRELALDYGAHERSLAEWLCERRARGHPPNP